MSTLRVRAYNVRFGDAILVSIPERQPSGRDVTRHLLIDVGNVLSGAGGVDTVFQPVIEDILRELGGKPVDLYVMTHEHMDHVQGLLFASDQLNLPIPVKNVWLTASAAPDYYDKHEKAKKRRLALEAAMDGIARFYGAAPQARTALVDALLLNNDYRSTKKCVDFLRAMAPDRTTFVYRGCDVKGTDPFREAKLHIWAPEEDTSTYYGAFRPMALGVADGGGGGASPTLTVPLPPSGVDAGAFYNLVEIRRQGHLDNLLTIDAANNNTSVVISLEWRGWKLLFPGDAEQRSWMEMDKQGVLEPVHFLKVGHHGSWNGTPPPELLDKVLPAKAPDDRPRKALVSTCADTYNKVPDTPTLDAIRSRCDLVTVGEPAEPSFVDVEFEGRSKSVRRTTRRIRA